MRFILRPETTLRYINDGSATMNANSEPVAVSDDNNHLLLTADTLLLMVARLIIIGVGVLLYDELLGALILLAVVLSLLPALASEQDHSQH